MHTGSDVLIQGRLIKLDENLGSKNPSFWIRAFSVSSIPLVKTVINSSSGKPRLSQYDYVQSGRKQMRKLSSVVHSVTGCFES